MILADMHTHSEFSGDSKTPMTAQADRALELGLKYYCFTDHEDLYYPEIIAEDGSVKNIFELDLDAYFKRLTGLKSEYSGKLEVLCGIELGLCDKALSEYEKIVSERPLDFVLGSVHLIDGMDPYSPEYWLYNDEKTAVNRYFVSMLELINKFTDFDSLGHLDYIFRYVLDEAGNPSDKIYAYREYAELIEPILKRVIELDKALEVNTGGYRQGPGTPNPQPQVLKKYFELGGRKITIGSDAHVSNHIAYDFDRCEDMLKEIGFDGYYIFKNRQPVKIKF